MGQPRTRTLIADDDRAFRDALADLVASQPDLELVGEAVDHPDAVRLATRTRPHLVVLDARMPGGDAPDTVRAMRSQAPDVAVLVLSAYQDAASAMELLAAGAVGYLVKGMADEEILDGIRRARRGQLSISTELAGECVATMHRNLQVGRTAHADALHTVNMLRQLLDRVPYAVVLVAGDGRIQLANSRVQQMFGYRRSAELVGEPITAVIPQLRAGEPADELVAWLLRRDSSGEAPPDDESTIERRFTTVARRRDGAEVPVEVCVNRLALGLRGVALFIRDISQSRVAETRHRQLFESSPDATVVVDLAGTIQQVNVAAERLFGYPRTDLLGRLVDLLLPDHPVIYRRDSDEVPVRLGRSAVPGGLELVGRRQDGTDFPVDMSIGRVQTGEGRQIMLSIRDMSQAVAARVSLERGIQALREADQEHRHRLVDLVRAQERERMRVAAGIHDDSLQVITAAALRLQQLRRRLHDPEHLKLLNRLDETIKLAADRLRNMIFDFRPPALEYEGLVAALHVYLDQLRSDTGVAYQLDSQLAAEPPAQTRAVIYRIAQEALMNVRKHAHANRVGVHLSEADDGYLVRIVDNGVGYQPAREPPATATSGHLGLTLMRDRAEIAGGWCRVDSAPDAGTTVEFWVPHDTGDARNGGHP